MTKRNEYLLKAYEKGYRVSKEGKLVNPKGLERNGWINTNGYLFFTIEKINIPLHKLQAYQKYGEELFKEGILVRHKNNIKTDCSWDNILIGTIKQNYNDNPLEKKIEFYCANRLKHLHDEIILDHLKGMSYKQLMLKYNISSKGTISYIIKKSSESKK